MSPELFRSVFCSLFGLKVLIKLLLNLLNFLHLRRNAGRVPEAIREWVDLSQLRKIDAYSAAKIRFQTVSFALDSLLLAVFLFTPLFTMYALWIEQLPLAPFGRGLLFFLAISWGGWLLELPLDAYFHFTIEQRFGFNQYTVRGWLSDALKGLAVSSLLTVVVLGLILAIWGGRTVFGFGDILAAWGIVSALTVLLMYLVPVVLIPLFYKLRPLPDGSLKDRLTTLVAASGFAARGIFVANQSQKSRHANAQFAGFGKSRSIILFDTLVNSYTDDEIVAVLAHEIGHGKMRHIPKLMLLVLLESFAFLAVAFTLLGADFPFVAFQVGKSFHTGLFLTYVLFFEVLAFYTQPFSARFSRKMEYEADAYSRQAIGAAGPLVSVFKKFIVNELANINPHPWYEAFYYSHPSLWKRIKALQ